MKLSVVVFSKNSEKIIDRVLKSVKFADETIVIDMQSNDETVKIASKYTDKIFAHHNFGYVEPVRNFGIAKATGDWILILDADEEVSSGLKKVIKGIVAGKYNQDVIEADCYYLPRNNIIFDRWIKKAGWWPDYTLRLFKKGYLEWSDKIHSVPITKGTVRELPARKDFALIHHNYQHIKQYIDRMNGYSNIQAHELENSQVVKITASSIFHQFSNEFLFRLFSYQGIDGGIHGLTLSLLQALSESSVLMKAWDSQGFPDKEKHSASNLIKELTIFKRDLAYWIADWQVEHSTGLSKLIWRVRRKLKV